MVEGRVEVVDAKRVHTQLLHENCISQTDIGIGEGVFTVLSLVCALASRLIVDTDDHETVTRNRVNEVAAANLDGVDSMSNIRAEGWEQQSCASKLCKLMVSDAGTAGNMGVVLTETISANDCQTTKLVEGKTQMPCRTASGDSGNSYTTRIMGSCRYRDRYAPTLVAGNLGRGGSAKTDYLPATVQ